MHYLSGFVPKMFIDLTGDQKIDQIKDKMKYALMDDDLSLLKEAVKDAEGVNNLEKEVNFCE